MAKGTKIGALVRLYRGVAIVVAAGIFGSFADGQVLHFGSPYGFQPGGLTLLNLYLGGITGRNAKCIEFTKLKAPQSMGNLGNLTSLQFLDQGSSLYFDNGNSPSLTRSPNGMYSSFIGFRTFAASGELSSSSTTASGPWGNPIGRTWGLIPFPSAVSNFALFDPSTNLTDPNSFSQAEPMGSVTLDGTQGWFVGTGTSNGVLYAPDGASSPTIISTSVVNGTSIKTANGNLFVAGQSPTGIQGIYRIQGMPTSLTTNSLLLYSPPSGSVLDMEVLDAQNMLAVISGLGVIELTLTNPGDTWDNLSSTPTVGSGLSITKLLSNGSGASQVSNIACDGVTVFATCRNDPANSLISFPLNSSNLNFGSAAVLASNNVLSTASYFAGISLAPEPSVVSASYNASAGAMTVGMRAVSNTPGNLGGYGRAIKLGNVSFTTYRSISPIGNNLDYVGHIQSVKTDSAGNQYLLNDWATADGTAYQYQILARNPSGVALTGSATLTAPAGFTPVTMAIDPNGTGNIAILMTSEGGSKAQMQLFSNDGQGTLATGTLLNNSGSYYQSFGEVQDVVWRGDGTLLALWCNDTDPGVFGEWVLNSYSGQTENFGKIAVESPDFCPLSIAATPGDNSNFQLLLYPQEAEFMAGNYNESFQVELYNFVTQQQTYFPQLEKDNTQLNTITGKSIQRQLMPMGLFEEPGTNNPIIYFCGANGAPVAGTPDTQAGVLGSFVAWRFSLTTQLPTDSTFRFLPGVNW